MKYASTISRVPMLVGAIWATASCSPDGTTSVRIEPADAHVLVDPGAAPRPVGFRLLAIDDDTGAATDVTGEATWRIEAPNAAALGVLVGDGTFTPAGIGGRAVIAADWNQRLATTALTLTLHADVFLDGTDEGTAKTFDTATPDSSAMAIEYPDDGTVVPSNLPPLELQWDQVDDNDLYRVRLRSPEIVDVAIYTRHREIIPPAGLWQKIGETTADEPVTLRVEGVGPAGLVRSSPDQALTITADQLDPHPIYTHASTGRARSFDPITGTERDLVTDAPAIQSGECNGCHRFSPDGSRLSYMRRIIGAPSLLINEYGVLRYDAEQSLYTETIAPVQGVWGGFPAFNPGEGATVPALLIPVPDPARHSTLMLVRPDTGAVPPSNLAAVLDAGPAAGQALLYPDWSVDGGLVVFSAYDPQYPNTFVGGTPYASILESAVSYDGGTGELSFGPPSVLVSRTTGDPNETDILPAISPDASAVAFVRGTTRQFDATQLSTELRHIAIVRRSDGIVFELAGSRGPADTDWGSNLAQWAPTAGSRYTWIVFSSKRPYGHVWPEAGTTPLPHLWIAAVDRAALLSGTENPTRPAFFLRGQVLSEIYVVPQWPNAPSP